MDEEKPSSDFASEQKPVLVTGGHGFIVCIVIRSSYTDVPNLYSTPRARMSLVVCICLGFAFESSIYPPDVQWMFPFATSSSKEIFVT